jgi:hypothetical protein
MLNVVYAILRSCDPGARSALDRIHSWITSFLSGARTGGDTTFKPSMETERADGLSRL